MSNIIDRRVVEMRFDNSNFESNVKQSMSTIDKLKSSMDFGNASNGFVAAIETVGDSFKALDVIAISALNNITNKVVDAGIQMVKSLTVDNISAGFAGYSDMTTSVGTLVKQGNELQNVTDELQKISWFSDETSYKFNSMVSSVGKFTASGQSLEDASTAIMGIANWAALSGQNAQTASGVMYQLSQAMSRGYMSFQDYASVQNANMDTAQFRQNVLDAAEAAGKITKVTSLDEFFANATKGFHDLDAETMKDLFSDSTTMLEKASKLHIDVGSEKVVAELESMMSAAQEAQAAFDKGDALYSLVGSANKTFTRTSFTKHLTSDRWFDSDIMMSVYKKYASSVESLYNLTDEFGITASEAITAARDSLVELEDGTKKIDLNKLAKNLNAIDGVEIDITNEDQVKLLSDLISGLGEFGLEAFSAAQEARTFEDMINSVKDAVSSQFRSIFETIFGNYDEAVQLWTALSNELWYVFAGPLESINEIFQSWKKDGGRDLLFSHDQENLGAFWELFYGVKELIEIIKSSAIDTFLGEDFDAAKWLLDVSVKIKETFANFRNNISESSDLRTVISGFFNGIKIGITMLKELWAALAPVRKFISSIVKEVWNLTVAFSSWITEQAKIINESGFFETLISNIKNGITNLWIKVKEFFNGLSNSKPSGVLTDLGNKLASFWEVIKNGFKSVTGLEIGRYFKTAIGFISKFFYAMFSIGKTAIDYILAHKDEIWAFVKNVFGFIKKLISPIYEGVSKISTKSFDLILKGIDILHLVFDKIKGLLEKKGEAPKEKTISIITIFKEVLNSVIELMPSIIELAKSVIKLFTALVDLMINRLENSKNESSVMKFIRNIGLIFIGIISAFTALIVAISALVDTFKKVNPVGSFQYILDSIGDFFSYAGKALMGIAFKNIAGAILQLAIALLILSVIPLPRLVTSVVIVAGFLGMIALFLKNLTSTLKMSVFTDMTSLSKTLNSYAAIFTSIGAAMILLSISMLLMSAIPETKIWDVVGAMAVIMTLLSGFVAESKMLDEKAGNSLSKMASSLVVLSSAMVILSFSVIALSVVPISKLWSAVGALAVIMTLLSGFIAESKMLNESGGNDLIKMAASIAILVTGLKLLVPVLLSFALIPWPSIGKAGAILGGLIVLLAVAAAVAAKSNATVTISAIGGAILFIGMAMLAAGAGFYLFGSALAQIAESGAAAAPVIIDFLKELITLIPLVGHALGEGFSEFFIAFFSKGEEFLEAFKIFANKFMEVVIELIPKMGTFLGELGIEILSKINELTPKITRVVLGLLIDTLTAIKDNSREIVSVSIGIVNQVLYGLIDRIPEIMQVTVDLILAFINGLGEAIENNAVAVREAVIGLFDHILVAFCDFFGFGNELRESSLFKESGGKIIHSLLKGLTDKAKEAWNTIKKIWDEHFGPAFDSWLDKIKETGKNLLAGLLKGITKGWEDVKNGTQKVAGWVVDTFEKVFGIASPSKVMAEIGKFLDLGLAEGMEDNTNPISEIVSKIADLVTNGIDDDALTITPILDLSEIQNGTEDISSLLSSISGTSLTGDLATNISGTVNSATSAKNTTAAVPQTSTTNNSSTTNNTFNITGDNPKEIAEEVSKIINKQVGRRVAAWA